MIEAIRTELPPGTACRASNSSSTRLNYAPDTLSRMKGAAAAR